MHRAALAAALLAGSALTACGGDDEPAGRPSSTSAAEPRPAATPCASLPVADPAATLPADFPQLPGQVLFKPLSQGKTRIVFGLVDGDDFEAVRDDLVRRLEQSKYEIVGTDQEAGEAEAQFDGPHEGALRVKPLCSGKLQLRYRLLS